jgi:hypothetical protein
MKKILVFTILCIFLVSCSTQSNSKDLSAYYSTALGICGITDMSLIDEYTQKIEFEVNSRDGIMGTDNKNGISESHCKYYLSKNVGGGEGVYSPLLEFSTCRLDLVWKDKTDKELIRGNCICYYKIKS